MLERSSSNLGTGLRIVVTVAVLLAVSTFDLDVQAGGGPYQPILQVIPNIHGARRPQSFLDACFNMHTWPTVLANATYLGAHGDLRDTVDDQTLANCFAQMNARGVQLTLEVGSVKPDCPNGGNCYSNTYFHWPILRQLGAQLNVLRMDEPLHAVMTHPFFAGNANMAYAVQKTADWIQQVRSNPDLAGMKIVDIEPYPAGFPGNAAQFLATWMVALHNECAARGIACPEVFELDYDPDISGGSTAEIRDVLIPAAHNTGQAFSYIYTNRQFSDNSTDNCTFAQAIGSRASSLGAVPDWFTVESWSLNPSTTVPEKGGGCTFMSAAKSLIDLDYYPTKTVVFYDDGNFNGDGFGATIGDIPFVGWEWNDRVQSLRIPAGLTVTLFEHSNYGGASISYAGPLNLPDLGGWNNSASSLKVFTGAPPPSGDYTDVPGGTNIYPEQSISSPNGRFALKYQNDGNLVLYDNGAPVWAINCWPECNSTGFQGNPFEPAGYTTMQTDGNFVTYNGFGGPVWHTWTFGNPGAFLRIGNDGSLAVRRSDGVILWQR